MAGDGPLRGQVRAAVDRLGLAADVELLGQVPVAQIKPLFDAASVFLFTSLRDSFGGQVLEALGRGLPAVALDHQGVGDADTGLAIVKVPLPDRPASLPAGLGAALQAVLTDDLWESRSKAALHWAGQQVWPEKAAAAVRAYESVAGW
jgi:glycosyltransferase involved in cell wall biosynthesis